MIQIAEELIEAVKRGEELILVPQMVLAKLAGGVTQRLQQSGDRRIVSFETRVSSRHSDFGKAGSNWILASDEGGPPGRAALLPVVVGERRSFIADSIDIGSPIAHLTPVIVADVPPADIVAPKNEDVRLIRLGHFNLLLLYCSFRRS
jgi:hypothetical protein